MPTDQDRCLQFPLHAQMREELYQILGGLASSVASFYQAAAAQPAWAAALVGDLDMLTNPHLRLAMRHIHIPLIKACPPPHRQAASCQHLTTDAAGWNALLIVLLSGLFQASSTFVGLVCICRLL